MIILNDLISIIYKYYPKGLRYGSNEYLNSQEYLNRISKYKSSVYLEDDFYNMIKDNLKEYYVKSWTDMEDFKCFEYRILLHEQQPIMDDDVELIQSLGGERRDLFIFVSALTKKYFYFINISKYNSLNKWTFSSTYESDISIISKIDNLFKERGYSSLDEQEISYKIDDVETEFCNIGEVDVFTCLFTDVTSITN
jgi:hypothetical protein